MRTCVEDLSAFVVIVCKFHSGMGKDPQSVHKGYISRVINHTLGTMKHRARSSNTPISVAKISFPASFLRRLFIQEGNHIDEQDQSSLGVYRGPFPHRPHIPQVIYNSLYLSITHAVTHLM